MKIEGKFGIGNILKIFLEICMIIGLLILIFLLKLLDLFNLKFDFFIATIYPCGLCFLGLIYQFIKLFDSLKNKNPFCKDNIKRLNYSIILSFIISILVFIALMLSIFAYSYYSNQLRYAIALVGILFFGLGIALYILSALFKEAINYKELNDLTI